MWRCLSGWRLWRGESDRLLNSKYLWFGLRWNVNDFLSQNPKDEGAIQQARAVDTALQERTHALNRHIKQALKRAKVLHIPGERPIKYIAVVLTKSLDAKTQMEQSICVNLECDVEHLANLTDYQKIGQQLIQYCEQGIAQLDDQPGLPSNVIRDACLSFKEQDYTILQFTKNGSVTDTPMKVRLKSYVNTLRTHQNCTVLYRGKELFSTTIKELDEVDWTLSACFHSMALQGHTMTFWPKAPDETEWWRKVHQRRPLHPLLEPVDINLDDFPKARDFMKSKRWII